MDPLTMSFLGPIISGILGATMNRAASAFGDGSPKAPPPPRTPLQPMGQNRQQRQQRNPYADAAASGGMQGSMDPGMIRLEAARSLRQGG